MRPTQRVELGAEISAQIAVRHCRKHRPSTHSSLLLPCPHPLLLCCPRVVLVDSGMCLRLCSGTLEPQGRKSSRPRGYCDKNAASLRLLLRTMEPWSIFSPCSCLWSSIACATASTPQRLRPSAASISSSSSAALFHSAAVDSHQCRSVLQRDGTRTWHDGQLQCLAILWSILLLGLFRGLRTHGNTAADILQLVQFARATDVRVMPCWNGTYLGSNKPCQAGWQRYCSNLETGLVDFIVC